GLLFIIFLEEACTDEIVKDFEDKEKAKTELMRIVSENVESELFNNKKSVKGMQKSSLFSEKFQVYIDLLISLAQYRDFRKVVYGEEVLLLKQKIIGKLSQNIIQGMTACLGKVTGKVKIVQPHANITFFEQGSILVAKMTTPDLMPLIKKAAAIVTDEGGVTS